jgi:hypothetical protein
LLIAHRDTSSHKDEQFIAEARSWSVGATSRSRMLTNNWLRDQSAVKGEEFFVEQTFLCLSTHINSRAMTARFYTTRLRWLDFD